MEGILKKRLLVILGLFLSGCTTIPRTPQYIKSYTQGIDTVFRDVNKLPLQNVYSYKIVSPQETTQPNIPEIRGTCIYIPQVFIDYIYKYYYDNSSEIFTCLVLHEISHTEFNLPDKPVETHYVVDEKAFNLFLSPVFPHDGIDKINEFYSFLKVIQNYSESLKGAEKHCFNILWNTANAASYLYAGFGSFGDWFAYDITSRIYYFQGKHLIKIKFIFKRSNFSKCR